MKEGIKFDILHLSLLYKIIRRILLHLPYQKHN